MSYVEDYGTASATTNGGTSGGSNGGGMNVTHGILIIFLFFLGLQLFGEAIFRKINNAL